MPENDLKTILPGPTAAANRGNRRRKAPPRERRWLRRTLTAGVVAAVLALPLMFGLRWLLTPGTIPLTQIAPGVFFECVQLDHPEHGKGAVMITEVHWDTPGVEIVFRPFDESVAEQGAHHRLALPSWMVLRHGYLVLMNTTRFGPGEWYRNLPGTPATCHESTVVDGKWSHIHEHSHMLWWDAEGNATLEARKPPSEPALSEAVMGVGMQAIHVSDGNVNHGSIGGHLDGAPFPQSYLGIDPERKVLWIMAYEHATERYASEFLAARGAKYGGRLDSGRGTANVIGPAARGLIPLLGIRNERLVSNYIAIRYRKP
jgi:hypothetical protein